MIFLFLVMKALWSTLLATFKSVIEYYYLQPTRLCIPSLWCLGLLWWLSGKESAYNAGDTCRRCKVWSLGQEDPLEQGVVTHSSNLAWETPWPEEPHGLRRVGYDLTTEQQRSAMMCLFCNWKLVPFDPLLQPLQAHWCLGKLRVSHFCCPFRIRATHKFHNTARIPLWSWGPSSTWRTLLALGSCRLPSSPPSTSLSSAPSWGWIWEGPVCPTRLLHLLRANQRLPPLPAPSTRRTLMKPTE